MAELSLQTFDHMDLSEYHSNNLKFTFVSIPHPVAPPPSSIGWYSVLATGVIAIPPSGPETVHSVKVFNLVLQINKQTDDSTLLDILEHLQGLHFAVQNQCQTVLVN
jgi:hypothetical protein